MNDYDYQDVLRPGLVHFMAYPAAQKGEGDIVGSVTRIAEDSFFTAIEITFISDPDLRSRVATLLREADMDVGYGAHPIILGGKLNPNALEADVREAVVARLKDSIDEAHELGAAGWTFLSGPYLGPETAEAQRDALVASTVELCRHAATYDMTVTCEQFDRDVEKRCLIGPASLTREYADRVRSEVDNFGICLDLSHLPILGEQAADTVPHVGEHFIHAHAGNAYLDDPDDPYYGDQHPPFGYAGSVNGVAELQDYIEVLWTTGYFAREGPGRLPLFAFEIKIPDETQVPQVLADTKRVFQDAWSRAEPG